MEAATAQDITVYGLSTDPLDKAQGTVDKLKLTFPVLYGVNGPATAETLGCWYEEKRNILQPAAFIIGSQRTLLNVTYSSGPIGRLRAQDALGLVGFYAKQKISVTTVDPQRGWTANVVGSSSQ
ncbi:MAG: redoxin domain-containing protein [Elusimicrobia bacterium]|nr:redoxin domain-containing protein [Elusimicrobiota bacterium]